MSGFKLTLRLAGCTCEMVVEVGLCTQNDELPPKDTIVGEVFSGTTGGRNHFSPPDLTRTEQTRQIVTLP